MVIVTDGAEALRGGVAVVAGATDTLRMRGSHLQQQAAAAALAAAGAVGPEADTSSGSSSSSPSSSDLDSD